MMVKGWSKYVGKHAGKKIVPPRIGEKFPIHHDEKECWVAVDYKGKYAINRNPRKTIIHIDLMVRNYVDPEFCDWHTKFVWVGPAYMFDENAVNAREIMNRLQNGEDADVIASEFYNDFATDPAYVDFAKVSII